MDRGIKPRPKIDEQVVIRILPKIYKSVSDVVLRFCTIVLGLKSYYKDCFGKVKAIF